MQNTGWRTILVDRHCELSLEDGCLKIIAASETTLYALSQIRDIMLMTQQVRMSAALISELADRNIGCVICDRKKNLSVQLISLGSRNARHNCLEQCDWTQDRKDEVWKAVIEKKIFNQIALLDAAGVEIPTELLDYADSVEPGDKTNREAIAARTYFRQLFGSEHTRWDQSDISSALNYGYSILASMINRIIVSHGYSPAIGIHHKSGENPFNLSYDIIEPFRPVVDAIVYENRESPFDPGYKKKLLDLYRASIQYGDRFLDLQTAIDCYSLDLFRSLNSDEMFLKELIL